MDRNREGQIKDLEKDIQWDIVVIGGGATGLGCAVDAASRGFKTLLVEQSDFAKGTSSRSTKLVHGGVRYLAAGDVALVYEALRERGLLLRNAAHLVKKQPFIIPCFSIFEQLKYVVGLKLYDWLSGRFSFGSSTILNKKSVEKALPGLDSTKLRGGVEYYDGQFDDARLAVNMAQTAIEQGATVLNYMKVEGLLKSGSKVNGVAVRDLETQITYNIKAKAVINATGVFVDDILSMDKPGSKALVRPSQGVHIVLDKSFMPADAALMIPETSDGRVLFAVPWHNYLVVGTTDTPLDKNSLEPEALQQEIDFILQTAALYLAKKPTEKDVLSVFAGLRPLAAPTKNTGKTKEISRSHKLIVSDTGLVTITGGKWTTYRKMAQDTIDQVIQVAKLSNAVCKTEALAIHGSTTQKLGNHLDFYGLDAAHIQNLMKQDSSLKALLHPKFPHYLAEVVWVTKNEMARTVEDVLARRLRILFVDAQAAIEMAPKVADLMASVLNQNEEWKAQQISNFITLAKQYLLNKHPVTPTYKEDQLLTKA